MAIMCMQFATAYSNEECCKEIEIEIMSDSVNARKKRKRCDEVKNVNNERKKRQQNEDVNNHEIISANVKKPIEEPSGGVVYNDELNALGFAMSNHEACRIYWDSGATAHLLDARMMFKEKRQSPGVIAGIGGPLEYYERGTTSARRDLRDAIIANDAPVQVASVGRYLDRRETIAMMFTKKYVIELNEEMVMEYLRRREHWYIGRREENRLYALHPDYYTNGEVVAAGRDKVRMLEAKNRVLTDHNRLGHATLDKLRMMKRKGTAVLLSSKQELAMIQGIHCQLCLTGRFNHRGSGKEGTTMRLLQPFERINVDFSGMRPAGRDRIMAQGNESRSFTSYIAAVDPSPLSKCRWAIPVKAQDIECTLYGLRKLLLVIMKNNPSKRVGHFRFDNDVFGTPEVKQFLDNAYNGGGQSFNVSSISYDFCTPHRHAENGPAEGSIRIIDRLATIMMHQAPDLLDHDDNFWPPAVRYSAYIDQKTPNATSEGGKSAHELMHGEVPDVRQMPEFGATCYVLRGRGGEFSDQALRVSDKFDSVTEVCIFLGIPSWETTGWLVLSPRKNTTYVRRSIMIDPNIDEITELRYTEIRAGMYPRKQYAVLKHVVRGAMNTNEEDIEVDSEEDEFSIETIEPTMEDDNASEETNNNEEEEEEVNEDDDDKKTVTATEPSRRITRAMKRAMAAKEGAEGESLAYVVMPDILLPEEPIFREDFVKEFVCAAGHENGKWDLTFDQIVRVSDKGQELVMVVKQPKTTKYTIAGKKKADVTLPKNGTEALTGRPPEEAMMWHSLMHAKFLDELRVRKTFKWTERKKGVRPMRSVWVPNIEVDDMGVIKRPKIRLALQGFRQIPGIHFDPTKTYAPVADVVTIKIFLAITSTIEGIIYKQFDVKRAFVQPEIDIKGMYMEVPYGCEGLRPSENSVLELLRPLEGCKQGAFLWWIMFKDLILTFRWKGVDEEAKFEQSDVDLCLFKYEGGGAKMYLLTWVDDAPVATTSEPLWEAFVLHLEETVELSYKGSLRLLLNCRFTKLEKGILVDQTQTVEEILRRWGMWECKSWKVPCKERNFEKWEGEKVEGFRSLLGQLGYLAMLTTGEIGTIVHVLAAYQNRPGPAHMKALKDVLRYLKWRHENGTLGLFVCGSKEAKQTSCHFDASHGSEHDGTSRTGVIIKVYGTTVLTVSKKQGFVARGAPMAEYYASSTAAYRIEHVRAIVEFFDGELSPTLVVTDSRAIRDSMIPNVPFRYNRWVLIYYRNVKFARDNKLWEVVWKNGRNGNHADVLTKVVKTVAKFTMHQEFISGLTHAEAAEIHRRFNARPSKFNGKMEMEVAHLCEVLGSFTLGNVSE